MVLIKIRIIWNLAHSLKKIVSLTDFALIVCHELKVDPSLVDKMTKHLEREPELSEKH